MPKIEIQNARVTKHGNHLTAGFDTPDARYHVNLNPQDRSVNPGSGRKGPTLYKNPPLGLDRYQPGHFDTRYLDATPGTASGKIVAELLAICESQGLFEKAEQEERERIAEEKRRDELRTKLYYRRAAGPQLFDALEAIMREYRHLMGPLAPEIIAAQQALAIAGGEDRRKFLCRPRAKPDQPRAEVYASNEAQAITEYVLSHSSERGILPDEVDVIEAPRG